MVMFLLSAEIDILLRLLDPVADRVDDWTTAT